MPLKSLFCANIAGLLLSSPVFARSATCRPTDAMLRAINSTAKAYGLPRELLQAIASVESCYGMHRYNSISHDYGLMQVNHTTAKALKLSTDRLLADDVYNLQASARVLTELRRHWPNWQCRYNVGTRRGPTIARLCRAYLAKLARAGYKP